MKPSNIPHVGLGLMLAAGLFLMTPDNHAHAQGISIGPNGLSLGGYYIPFNDGGAYNNRGGNYGPGGYYDSRDYYSRGYNGRAYGRSGVYWSPGMYWAPNDYWYGDRDWARYNTGGLGNWNDTPSGLIPRRSDGNSNSYSNLPPLPQIEELERMNWTHLRRVLAYGATQLEEGLNRMTNGAKWASYLRLNQLQTIVAQQKNVPPTREESAALLSLLEKFNQTAEDDRYASISSQWGFETIHRGLAEFLENPAVRYRQQLVMNSTDLDRALDRFGTGAGWQQHLSLPADLFVDAKDAASVKSPPDPEALRKALLKYDEVAKNPAYRVIGDLPEFQATHVSLARYLGRELPAGGETTTDETPDPPADPALNEPMPAILTPQADPFDGKPNDSAPKGSPQAKPAPNSVLKPQPLPNQPEELFPPPGDSPQRPVPAVREKE